MFQVVLTPAAGKRLIAKAIAFHPAIQAALRSETIAIIAGTTNGYVAEEILALTGQSEGFVRQRFFRGVTLPPNTPTTDTGRLPDETGFPGDIVIVKGNWQRGKTIFDIVDALKEGDVILKGANSLDLLNKRAAILIGHPRGGTITAALQAVTGRRVRLLIPVGLEKRISGDIDELSAKLNAPGSYFHSYRRNRRTCRGGRCLWGGRIGKAHCQRGNEERKTSEGAHQVIVIRTWLCSLDECQPLLSTTAR